MGTKWGKGASTNSRTRGIHRGQAQGELGEVDDMKNGGLMLDIEVGSVDIVEVGEFSFAYVEALVAVADAARALRLHAIYDEDWWDEWEKLCDVLDVLEGIED